MISHLGFHVFSARISPVHKWRRNSRLLYFVLSRRYFSLPGDTLCLDALITRRMFLVNSRHYTRSQISIYHTRSLSVLYSRVCVPQQLYLKKSPVPFSTQWRFHFCRKVEPMILLRCWVLPPFIFRTTYNNTICTTRLQSYHISKHVSRMDWYPEKINSMLMMIMLILSSDRTPYFRPALSYSNSYIFFVYRRRIFKMIYQIGRELRCGDVLLGIMVKYVSFSAGITRQFEHNLSLQLRTS